MRRTVALVIALCACTEDTRQQPPPARPKPNHLLSVEMDGAGQVTLSAASEVCDGSCSAVIAEGTAVTLTAEAASDWVLGGWSGDCAGSGATATVLVDADRTCKITFIRGGVRLTVVKVGQGHVTSLPAGVDCGTDCEEWFDKNRLVILDADADSDWTFIGWSPSNCGGFSVGASTTCTATFTPNFLSRTWGTAGADQAMTLLAHPSGGYMLGGAMGGDGGTADTWFARVGEDGEPVWHKSFANPRSDGGGVIASAPDGWLVAAGSAHGYDSNFWAAKVDSSGAPVWQKRWDRAQREMVTFATTLAAGGWLLGGSADTGSFTFGFFPRLMKLDATGGVAWQKQYTDGNDVQFVSEAVESTDGYCVVGTTADAFGAGGAQAILYKIDQQGGVAWAKTYAGSSLVEGFRSIVKDGDGYVIVGLTGSWGAGDKDALVIKIDGQGAILWQRAIGGAGEDIATRIVPIPGGGFLVLGTTKSFGAAKLDAWVLWLWSNGSLGVQRAYGGAEDDVLQVAAPFATGGAFVAGRSGSFGDTAGDLWAMKLAPWGALSFAGTSGGSARTTNGVEATTALTVATAAVTAATTTSSEVVTTLTLTTPALTPRAQAP